MTEPNRAARIVGQAIAALLVTAASAALVIVLVRLLLVLARWSWDL